MSLGLGDPMVSHYVGGVVYSAVDALWFQIKKYLLRAGVDFSLYLLLVIFAI